MLKCYTQDPVLFWIIKQKQLLKLCLLLLHTYIHWNSSYRESPNPDTNLIGDNPHKFRFQLLFF